MSPTTATTHIFDVSIAVYRGEPLDYQRYRHTALCFRSVDGRLSRNSTVPNTSATFEPVLAPVAAGPPSPPLSSASAPSPPLHSHADFASNFPLSLPQEKHTQRLGEECGQNPDSSIPCVGTGPAIILHAVTSASHSKTWEVAVAANIEPAVLFTTSPKHGSSMGRRTLAKEVPVGQLARPLTKARLVHFISQTPVDNDDPEFNCQVWVEAALTRLATENALGDGGSLLLSMEDYQNGFDAMVDATMEAADELAI